MKKIKNNVKGITLVSLIITVIVLLILSSIAIYSGSDVLKASKFTKFTTELKIMQTQVNQLYDKYKSGDNEVLNLGKEVDTVQTQANTVFTSNASGITDKTGYRYFDQQTIKNLNIEGIEEEFFINIEKRSVVSYKGFKYEGKMYYTLEQIPSGLYNIDYENKNTGKPTFKVETNKIGENKWKINISDIEYSGYINKWKVNYKLEGQNNWNASKDYSFIVKEGGKYSIQLVNGITKSEEIKVIVGEIANLLPSEYQQVEYIEGTGTQWIDTGYINSEDYKPYKIEMDFQFTDVSKQGFAFGSVKTEGNNYPLIFGIDVDQNKWIFGHYGNSGSSVRFGTPDTNRHQVSYIFNEGLYYDEELIETTVGQASTSSISTKNIGLFARIRNTTPQGFAYMKMYSCKFYEENDILVRDFIPCYKKATGQRGLYDIVEGKFYTNQGTVTKDFEKGTNINNVHNSISKLPSAYQRVDYIEGTGTQYIDTGIPSQVNLTVKAEIVSLNDKIFMTALGANVGLHVDVNFGYFSSGSESTGVKATLGTMYNVIAEQTEDNRCVTVNGYTASTTKASKSYNIYLFGLNDNNNLYKGSGGSSNMPAVFQGRIGKTEIYISEELKRYFIPCYRKVDGVIGMYDTVENKFYTNQGTGTFEKGADVN